MTTEVVPGRRRPAHRRLRTGTAVIGDHGLMVVDRYLRALLPWSSPDEPGPDDTVVAVRVGGDPGNARTFCLVFDSTDLVGCWWRDVPTPAVRLSAPRSALREVVSRARTGSAAVMSGRVSIDGDRRTLARLAAFTDRPRMRSYMARLSEIFGSEVPCPPPAPGLRTGSPVVAVLGSPNDPGGSISRIAMDRCQAAVELCRVQPGAHLVLTGGFGAQFNTSSQPHWQHCARWITQRWAGAGHRIVGAVESRHTYEDIFLVREVVRSIGSPPVTVVTSDYHAARVRLLLDLLLPEAAVHATTHPTIDHDERRRLDRHESRALPLTVAATLLFGADPRPGMSLDVDGGRLVLRPL